MCRYMCVCVSCSNHVWIFETPWTMAHQAFLSLGSSWQGYWSELPFSSPGDLHGPGIEPGSPALQLDSLPSEPAGKPYRYTCIYMYKLVYILIISSETIRRLCGQSNKEESPPLDPFLYSILSTITYFTWGGSKQIVTTQTSKKGWEHLGCLGKMSRSFRTEVLMATSNFTLEMNFKGHGSAPLFPQPQCPLYAFI